MGLVYLGIDIGTGKDIASFCVMYNGEILYMGSDPKELRKYDIDVVCTHEALTVKRLKNILKKEEGK